jgi:hypothetical protein
MDKELPTIACEAKERRSAKFASAAAAILSYLTLAGGLGTLAAMVNLVVRSYTCLPYWDMWSVPTFLAKPTQPTLHWLWAQHNEHRILLSKIVLLLDYRWFYGLDIFPLCCIFLTQLTLLTVLLWAAAAMGRMRGTLWRAVAGISALCLFSTAQWENFVNGFQLAFFFVGLFFSLAIIAVLRSGPEDGVLRGTQWRYAVLAMLAGAAATYSLANGIIVWPIMILVAVLNRCRKNIIVFEAISGLLIAGSYLYHYRTPLPRISPWQWLQHPYLIAVYVVKYVGAPLDFDHLRLAGVFGVIGVAAALLLLLRIMLSSERQPFLLFLASLLLFVVASAAMTALGRLNFGTDQALSSRYNTAALLLWLSLAIWLLRFVGRRSALALVAVETGLLLVICLGAARLKYPMRQAGQRKLRANTASLAILSGVFDQQALVAIYPNAVLPWQVARFFKHQRVSIFATALARNLNQPVAAVYRIRPQSCWGEVTAAEAIAQSAGSGVRLSGWAWDPFRRGAVKEVVFAAGGEIVGYATPGVWRPDLSVQFGARSARRAGWIGYVGAVAQNSIVAAYAVVPPGRHAQACALVHPPTAPKGSVGEPVLFRAPPSVE